MNTPLSGIMNQMAQWNKYHITLSINPIQKRKKMFYNVIYIISFLDWILTLQKWNKINAIWVSFSFCKIVHNIDSDNLCPCLFVAVSVGGLPGLWPFRFVAVPVCGLYGVWSFRFVAVLVCGLSVCVRSYLWRCARLDIKKVEAVQHKASHYSDFIMSAMASQITSLAIGYSTVYSGAGQRKHQSSASLAFVRGLHRGPVNSPHKWPVTRKMFSSDDVIMEVHHRWLEPIEQCDMTQQCRCWASKASRSAFSSDD